MRKQPELSEEDLSNLGDEIQIWMKSRFWILIVKPFLEDSSLNEAENLFKNGIDYTNEEKNAVIRMVRLTMAFKEEIERWESRCNQAKSSLAKKVNGDTLKRPPGGSNG